MKGTHFFYGIFLKVFAPLPPNHSPKKETSALASTSPNEQECPSPAS